jgi:hypothetical protein
MAIKIQNNTIIDDSRNIVNAGIATANHFDGFVSGGDKLYNTNTTIGNNKSNVSLESDIIVQNGTTLTVSSGSTVVLNPFDFENSSINELNAKKISSNILSVGETKPNIILDGKTGNIQTFGDILNMHGDPILSQMGSILSIETRTRTGGWSNTTSTYTNTPVGMGYRRKRLNSAILIYVELFYVLETSTDNEVGGGFRLIAAGDAVSEKERLIYNPSNGGTAGQARDLFFRASTLTTGSLQVRGKHSFMAIDNTKESYPYIYYQVQGARDNVSGTTIRLNTNSGRSYITVIELAGLEAHV